MHPLQTYPAEMMGSPLSFMGHNSESMPRSKDLSPGPPPGKNSPSALGGQAVQISQHDAPESEVESLFGFPAAIAEIQLAGFAHNALID